MRRHADGLRKTRSRRRFFEQATRVRLVLNPGQTAGLDSEEGRSLNFTCDEGATALLVDSGEREKLVELQKLPLRKTASD